jgi:hypothetical protein
MLSLQVPSGGVVVRAGAYITLFVARAGIALQGTIMQMSLAPQLTLVVGPSGKITACFDVSIELRPLVIQLQARIGYLACFDWYEVCCFLGCIKVPVLT